MDGTIFIIIWAILIILAALVEMNTMDLTSIWFAVGALIAEKAKAAGLSQAIFDRGSYRFHGRVAAVAEGAREAGLKI